MSPMRFAGSSKCCRSTINSIAELSCIVILFELSVCISALISATIIGITISFSNIASA